MLLDCWLEVVEMMMMGRLFHRDSERWRGGMKIINNYCTVRESGLKSRLDPKGQRDAK